MEDSELLQYSAHILLPEMGIAGVERLQAAHVLIVGVGGLGTVVATYLARSGVGTLTLADDDVVSLSNLPRQILYARDDIGKKKVDIAAGVLAHIGAGRVTTIPERLAGNRLQRAVARADLVCDASDNFATRFAVNAACVPAQRALVSAAVIRLEGQLLAVDPNDRAGGCYRCLYADTDRPDDDRCIQRGILAPVAGVMGCLQAIEAIKILVGMPTTLRHELLVFDAQTLAMHRIRRRQDPECPVCAVATRAKPPPI
ncbi:MAG: HesA/MoeB/ThiF family protein [Acidiferrobacter sp.]